MIKLSHLSSKSVFSTKSIIISLSTLLTILSLFSFKGLDRDISLNGNPDNYLHAPFNLRNNRFFHLEIDPSNIYRNTKASANTNDTKFSSIGVSVGTYSRVNDCTLVMKIGSELASTPLNCKSIKDNSIVAFEFKENVPTGVQQVEFIMNSKSGADFVAVYGAKEKDSDRIWLKATAPSRSVSIIEILQKMAKFHKPYTPYIYGILILVLFGLAIIRPSSAFFPGIICLFVHLVITTPYSGFDETAHIDMAYSSVVHPNPVRHFFNEHVYDELVRFEFSSLHKVPLGKRGDCPHSLILWGCGKKKEAENYYYYWGKFSRIFTDNFFPPDVRHYFKIFNVSIFVTFALFVLACFGITTGMSLLTFLLLVDSFTTKITSINNDLPMFLLGISLALCLVSYIKKPRLKVLAVGILANFFLYLFVRRFDVSHFAALPATLPILFIAFSKPILLDRNNTFLKNIITGLFAIVSSVVIVTLLFKISSSLPSLIDFASESACSHNLPCYFLSNLKQDIGFSQLISDQIVYLKSLMGSYIWGHSYGAPWAYLLKILAFIYFTGKGFLNIQSNSVRMMLIFSLAMAFVIIKIAYLPGSADLEIVRESFLKPRLTAPGIYAYLVLPLIGVLNLSRKESIGITLLFLINAIYVLPQVYLAESF